MKDNYLLENPIQLTSELPRINLINKNILLRVDLNVPLSDNSVAPYSDLKLQEIIPTLTYILAQKPKKVVLLTHLGNPTFKDPALSTKHLMPWFTQRGFICSFASTITELKEQLTNATLPPLILFENLRFFPEEKNNGITFAQMLAENMDIYINDAFGALHRSDTSLTLLPEQFLPDKRTIGFLIEKELKQLNVLFINPKRPLLLFIGGKKIQDKLPYIRSLLPHIDELFLCPAIVFSFLKNEQKSIGASLVDPDALIECKKIIELAKHLNKPIHMPIDYIVLDENNRYAITELPLQMHEQGICIGPKTVEKWKKIINKSSTIIYNGAQGFLTQPDTLIGMKQLYEAFACGSTKVVIAGGDSTAIAHYFHVPLHHIILSTGGGATLCYLSGQSLPGLQSFIKK